MYTRILVPLDGSKLAEQVLPYVRILAKGLHSQAELLRVVEPLPPIGLMDPYREVHRQQLTASLTNQAKDYLEEIAEPFRDDRPTVSYSVRHGNPESEIVSEAESGPATMIAMSTHGRSGLGRWALGSVADKVLHVTNLPLLIVRPQEQKASEREGKLENVIVPLDGTEMAEQALPHLTRIAKALGLKVILVRVTPSAGEYHRYTENFPEGGAAPVYVRQFLEVSENVDSQAMGYLHEVKTKLLQQKVSSVDEHLLHGHPAAAIVDLARQTPHNLIVMTTHARPGLQRWVLGSVADRVVRHSRNPVLFIRPTEESPRED